MQIEITEASLEKGKLVLTCKSTHDAFRVLGMIDSPGEYEIKKAEAKRSLSANKYMWKLCDQIGSAIRETKNDVYRNAIKRVGIYKEFPPLPENDAKTLRTAWEMLGEGWVTEIVDFGPDQEKVILRCYYGSSTYTTKQMSRLIEDLVQDAENLGIETLEEEKLRTMMEEYEQQQERIRNKPRQ